MTIAIDFDGTIHDHAHPKPGMVMGEPLPGAKDALLTFKRQGDTIIIHTARDRFKPVEDWMRYYNIPYDRVTNIKPPEAQVFIDDRAIRFTSWEQVLRYL